MPVSVIDSAATRHSGLGRLLLSGLATLLALACLYWRSLYFPGNGFVPLANALFTVLASLAVIGFLPAIAGRFQLKRIFAARGMVYVSAAVHFCLVLKLGTYQFGGYDESGIVHAAAFYDQGLRPMVDFQCAMPPLFLAGIRLALICFGMHWLSFALLAASFAAATLLWLFALLRLASFPAHWALAVALIIEGATMFAVPIWWYNNTTSLATVLLLISVLACIRVPNAKATWISLAIALAMLVTSKPNAAPASLMVLVLFVTRDRSRWIRAGLSCFGAVALALLICRFAQTPLDLLRASYSEVAQLRGNPFLAYPWKLLHPMERLSEFVFALLLTMCAADLLVRSIRRGSRPWRVISVCAVIFVSALLLLLTNADVEITSLVGMFVGCAVLCVGQSGIEGGSQVRTLLVTFTVVFAVSAGLIGFTHTRIRNIGESMFYEPYATQTIHTGFLRGLQAGPRLQRVLAQSQQALERYPSSVVFFGPRMEFEYAVFNRPVMRGMPLFWDSEGNFSPSRFPQFIALIREQDPDILIFLKNDSTRMGTVAEYIKSSPTYQRVDSFEDLTVYVRKQAEQAGSH